MSGDISGFFDLSKEWKPPPKVLGLSVRVMRQEILKANKQTESDWDEAPIYSSTEYARQYIEENNLEYFKVV